MIKWNKKFEYPKTIREAIEGQRHYIINEEKLPSVTTILQATQSEEKKASLQNWMKRVGSDNAEHIKKKHCVGVQKCYHIFTTQDDPARIN